MIPADLDEARPDVERIVEITSRIQLSLDSAIWLARNGEDLEVKKGF
jgi:hypothetical protein